ncbi:MAG: serine/threonine protein kinase [Blastocatellia bacterium]|nr:serine/threonine protein kinase [Blastocatellia bacterium]MBN8722123.1 serine/threonine protein kinase [Acidobacteriota bacterium]
MSGKTGQISYFNSLLGKLLNQTYRIDSQVALGGMGAVFRGVQVSTNEVVAIKVISPHLTANSVFVKRFQREAKVGSLLSHPNIVKVHEFGETPEGILFMAMEFIEGKTLDEYITHSSPLNVMRALEILRPLSEALDTAHKRNILHRDLKPANVLLAKDSQGKEVIKLVDFGLVKLLQPDSEITAGSNLTAMGEACGTPYYMSPEQIIGQQLGPTADIYSLGIILYQMLTGKMPIESNNVRQILAIKINQDPPVASQKFPFIPKVLDVVLQTALSRDPRKRYQTAKELFDNFQKAVFEISLEYSQATQPVLDQGMISELRQEYSISQKDLSFSNNSLEQTPNLSPIAEIATINNTATKPSNIIAINSPITQVPPLNKIPQPSEIDSSPSINSNSMNSMNSDSFSREVHQSSISPRETSEKQVKFLIITVGVLFGLLIITLALYLTQNP